MKRILALFMLVFCLVAALSTALAPAASAYVGDPLMEPCRLCYSYGVPWACYNCHINEWWNGDGCFPGDPDCY